MIVPLISTLQKLPQDLEDASADLVSNKWQTFWRVTIPQSIPSIAAGMSLGPAPESAGSRGAGGAFVNSMISGTSGVSGVAGA